MAEAIAILEDNAERAAAFRACARELLKGTDVLVFDCAQDMVLWLDRSLAQSVLISLDHDLADIERDRARADAGTGRDVADWLATKPAICPVIVHTSNESAAQGMIRVLREAGWPVYQVRPCDDLGWIRQGWTDAVTDLKVSGWIK